MKSIYLIGFMGAGKTTIGKELAACLNKEVIDTDEEIVKREKKSINDIFTEQGELYFRLLETKMLQELNNRDAVITTGGGIVVRPENREALKGKGNVFFLYATPEEIFKRLENDQSRPLLKGDKIKQIHELYEERMPLYKDAANVIIDTTHKESGFIIKEIISRLE
ncbi:shikimate kinase [Bacillus sp. ISL-47]|uniref:shikimate kinase n=1 Tax=Bacillus sp. ISL-47 TaxID=2819130 RepID=UPI001BECBE41|nr:shikimate kinase [Bacillus sp. ISL-47]MBT2687072.1 shikimate kinase [Bacillus sp. ISL-47]MBT2707372.1 shikimate kinase [Pseudomonas sp. ISL-84]